MSFKDIVWLPIRTAGKFIRKEKLFFFSRNQQVILLSCLKKGDCFLAAQLNEIKKLSALHRFLCSCVSACTVDQLEMTVLMTLLNTDEPDSIPNADLDPYHPLWTFSLFSFLILSFHFLWISKLERSPRRSLCEREAVPATCSDRSALIFENKLALAPKELISTSLHQLSKEAGHCQRACPLIFQQVAIVKGDKRECNCEIYI